MSCGEDEEEELLNGGLPTRNVGDEWVYKFVSEGVTYTVTEQITGEDVVDGNDCCIIEASFTPPFYDIVESATTREDKATMNTIAIQMTGTSMGFPYMMEVTSSYEYPESPKWPLEVGKAIKEIEASTITTTMMGETETETETYTYIYEVEKVEEIDVSAGTFKCFKIVQYDEEGAKLLTFWYSDKVKRVIKQVDHEIGDRMELKSYSVQ